MDELVLKDIVNEFFPQYSGKVELICYKILNMDDSELKQGIVKFKLEGCICIYFKGKVKYLDFLNKDIRHMDLHVKNETFYLEHPKVQNFEAPDGKYFLIISLKDYEQERSNLRNSLNIGLVGLMEGKNILYTKMFNNVFDLKTNKKTSGEFRLLNPRSLPKPKSSSIESIAEISEKISQLNNDNYNNVKLSLHWFEKSIHLKNIDYIITIWTAIEILMLPEGYTNTKPLKDSLSRLYGISKQEVGETFFIGRIERLRGNILHNGLLPKFSQQSLPFFEYMRYLYHDFLIERLSIDIPPKSKPFIDKKGISILSIIESLYPKD